MTVYSKADRLSDNNVYPIFEDRQGVVWIGTTKGVFKYQNSGFTLVKSSAGFYVDAFGEDASGRLLVSTFGSLYVLDKEQLKQFYKSESGVIWAIHTDRENALWIGSQHGLARLKDNIKTTFTTADGLAANHIKVIIDDKNGGVWIGSYGGLTHFNNGKFEKWTESEGLPTPTIRSLYLDSDNTLWIGSYDSGMARFKDGKFTHYNTKNGLYNDGAFQILEDERQNFWISSNRGIYRVNKNELNEFAEGKRGSITSVGYGKSDGMLSVEANGGRMPGGIRASDGRLWFPTQDGVAVINPETVKINPQPPPVIIEDIKIDNQSINVETNKSEIRNSKSQIQIEPNQQNFEIQYTALSFINSENLRFKYKLEGLDSNWIDAATRRTAYFSHVPPGEYTFTVIAANSDGIWNEQGASVNITILPRFHQTWQFIVLSVLAIAAAAYFLFKRRLMRVESQRLAQQNFSRQLIASQEQERKRIAGELHDGLGQTLAMIRNRAILGSEDLNDLNLAEEQFAIITEQTGQAIGEVREIAYNLRPYLLDRLGLTKALHSLVLKTAETGKIKLTEKIDELDNLLPPDSEISVYRIVQECLSNILKHAEADELAVVIKKRETHLQIQIVDDGKGFDPNAPIKKDGGGFGLLSLNERIRMLGGSFKIESEIGKGTKIDIIIEIVN